MTNAIILSAGQGRRLLPLTGNLPKCMLKVGDRTVLEWQVNTLLDTGIERIFVVAGFNIDMVSTHLGDKFPGRENIEVIFNPFYQVSDNLASCWMARSAMLEDFLLLNGDTLFEQALLEKLLQSNPGAVTLTVDHKDSYDDDDMKVELEGDRVIAVGKLLPAQQTHAESIGLLYFRDNGIELFRQNLETEMRTAAGLTSWFLRIVDTLAKKNRVNACNINGLKWCEIDFLEDLQAAQSVFAPAAA